MQAATRGSIESFGLQDGVYAVIQSTCTLPCALSGGGGPVVTVSA